MEGVVYRADPSFKFLPIALPFFAKLVLRRVDIENPWILQELMRAAATGGMWERLGSLVEMALSDEPETVGELLRSLMDVLAHPGATALRSEIRERILSGGLDGLLSVMPGDLKLGVSEVHTLESFLASATGKDLVFAILEDERFPMALARWIAQRENLPAFRLNWPVLLQAWLASPADQMRLVGVFQRLIVSSEKPVREWVSAHVFRDVHEIISQGFGLQGLRGLPDWLFGLMPPGGVAQGILKNLGGRLNDSVRRFL